MTAVSFRSFGPLHRFDHQRHPFGTPLADPGRAIAYFGFALSCAVVEVFGESRIIKTADYFVAVARTTRDLQLLELRGSGSMRAGATALLASVEDRPRSQAWSQYFYDNPALYREVDGLWFNNSHNSEDSLALYERADGTLSVESDEPLSDPRFLTDLQYIARQNNMHGPTQRGRPRG